MVGLEIQKNRNQKTKSRQKKNKVYILHNEKCKYKRQKKNNFECT